MSNIAKVKTYDIANGCGICTSVFFSGCPHQCKGCFNKELWRYDVGNKFTRAFYENKIKPTINEHINHLSLLGGCPLCPENVEATRDLVVWFKEDFPDKKVWLWTGYLLEELLALNPYENDCQKNALKELLPLIDVLVDGKFIEEQKDLTLRWCGSKNQRVIDLPKTLKEGGVVLYEK